MDFKFYVYLLVFIINICSFVMLLDIVLFFLFVLALSAFVQDVTRSLVTMCLFVIGLQLISYIWFTLSNVELCLLQQC